MLSAAQSVSAEDANAQLQFLHSSGRSDEARRLLAEIACADDWQSVSVTHLYANLLLQWGHRDEAMTLLNDACGLDPADPLILNDLAVIRFERRELQAAEQLFRQALAIDPHLENALANLHDTQALLNSARGFLAQAREAWLAWQLNSAMTLVNQALAIAVDLSEGERLKRSLLIEFGDYGTLRRWNSNEHDARSFKIIAQAIGAGKLTSGTRLGPRREMHPEVFEITRDPDFRLPSSLEDLRHGLLAGRDENYPAGVTWLSHWLNNDVRGWSVRMIDSGDARIALEVSNETGSELTLYDRQALLLEITVRVTDQRLILVASAALLRAMRAAGDMEGARKMEEFISADSPDIKGLLNHLLYCDTPSREACGSSPVRQNFVLIGTCIAEGVRFFLNLSPGFRARFRLRHYITNRAAPSMSEFAIEDEVLKQSEVIVHVAPQWADWGNEQAYLDLLARIPKQVRRISFPYPVFQPLWPFHCRDPRNGNDLPEIFWRPHEERPRYPYGDSRVLGLMRELGDANEVVRRYLTMDLADEIDLDRLLAKTLEIHAEKERFTDIKIVDFIAENFRQRRLFDSVNHITNASTLHIANQILHQLEFAPVAESVLETSSEILSPEVPIHPSVRRYFGLTYLTDDTRYAVDPHRRLTYAEYLAQYVRFQ